MKLSKYIFMVVISLVLTSCMLLKLCDNITYQATIICDFIAMIGGGIFCSTIVSWFIDGQNNAKEKNIKGEQRKFIFASVKNGFIHLLQRELLEMSTYYAKYLTNHPVEWIQEDVELFNVREKLLWLIEKIEANEEAELKSNNHIISVDSMKKDDDKRRHLVGSNKSYYKSLQQMLLDLSTNYNAYLIAGIINEQKIELLKELTWEINDVLMFEPEYGVDDGTVLVFKRLLFEKASQYFEALDISENETVHSHYKNVFHE